MNDRRGGNTLSGNAVAGDVAGENIDKSTHINLPNAKRPLKEKLKKLAEDGLQDPNFMTYLDQLKHYRNPVRHDEQRNLETKLTDADRDDEIFNAKKLKEEFAKILAKDDLSNQAQEAYVHILGKIQTYYERKVKPLIKMNAPPPDIDTKVLEIIEEIYSDLVETNLNINHRQIEGMLYFLTGNCHIDWKY